MMAVQTANALFESGIASFLCATRNEGQLKNKLHSKVGYIFLKKKNAFDLLAIRKLLSFIRLNNIDIIHAHSSSFFTAWLIKLIIPTLKLIWHDHYGNSEFLNDRKVQPLRFCSRWFSAIVPVNTKLLEWGSLNLNCDKIELLMNYPDLDFSINKTTLLGDPYKRIVCVAGFRPQKNHLMLLKAFKKIKHLGWTLHLVGNISDKSYFDDLEMFIEHNNLSDEVFFYHNCIDIGNILMQSTIGALSSSSEGLPVSLLEYGLAGLPIIATDVGEISRVISDHSLGILVPINNDTCFANSLESLILDEHKRKDFGNAIYLKIMSEYSSQNYLSKLLNLYSSE